MAILHRNKTFCRASLAVKNLRTSLDVQKQGFLFSGDSRRPAQRSIECYSLIRKPLLVVTIAVDHSNAQERSCLKETDLDKRENATRLFSRMFYFSIIREGLWMTSNHHFVVQVPQDSCN